MAAEWQNGGNFARDEHEHQRLIIKGGYDEGEDYGSDLDDLRPDELEKLEDQAIGFTQFTQAQGQVSLSTYGDTEGDDDLDNAEVYDETQNPPQPLPSRIPQTFSQTAQQEQFRRSRYGVGSNLNSIPPKLVNPAWRPPQPRSRVPNAVPIRSSQPQVNRAPYVRAQVQSSAPPASVDPNIEALQKQIRELQHNQEQLQQDLSAKTGEIAIVRSKQEKAAKEYERTLIATTKQNAEDKLTLQKQIDAAKAGEKSAATELSFLQLEMMQLQSTRPKPKPRNTEPVSTPKKNKTAIHRDGFDDDEMMVISPSKFPGKKSNGGTPTKNKRKYNGERESPMKALEIRRDKSPDNQSQTNAVVLDAALLERLRQPDDRLSFLELMMDHRPYSGHLRTFEEFAKLAFPTSPDESLASIVLGRLSGISKKRSPSEFPIEFCELIISIWSRCLEERFYKPMHLLVDLLTFALELKTVAVAPFIMDNLLRVVQLAIDIVAIPRWQEQALIKYDKDVDVNACLELLCLSAQGCISKKEDHERFWRLVRIDLILCLLSHRQPLEHFHKTMQFLSLSVTRDSFGPRSTDQESQKMQESSLLDRITQYVAFKPPIPDEKKKDAPSFIRDFRLQILRTLDSFCYTASGIESCAMHRSVIGRLAKFISDELDTLYDYNSGHKQSAQLICLATRIAHRLVTTHWNDISLPSKLSIIHGGWQKYLLCLARLTFAENDLVLEEDIDTEVSECAREMLELAATPEESKGIEEAWGVVVEGEGEEEEEEEQEEA